jgi:methylated-DNA-[protein]-cysteine S-methyltransferase
MKPQSPETLEETSIETPVGRLVLLASAKGLTHVLLGGPVKTPRKTRVSANPRALGHLEAARRALDEYFAGGREGFDDVSLAPAGTPFQLSVWRELLSIPYGETTTYGRMAKRIGTRNAHRAVGAANARNPIPVIIPCHRVIGADGRLTGYAGGLPMKKWLLTHEDLRRAVAQLS